MGQGIIVLLQWLWEWKYWGQREGQARSPTKSEGDSANTKLYKHTQTLALRKVGGIVRGEGWYSNPSVLTAEKFSE